MVRLKKHFNKTRSDENWFLYKAQMKICTKLLRKTKKYYVLKGLINLALNEGRCESFKNMVIE